MFTILLRQRISPPSREMRENVIFSSTRVPAGKFDEEKLGAIKGGTTTVLTRVLMSVPSIMLKGTGEPRTAVYCTKYLLV
eukprot:09748_5